MIQNDRPSGRLICLVDIAPLHPAEFVIFRIGQKSGGNWLEKLAGKVTGTYKCPT